MKYQFPPTNQSFKYLQTNRSDDLGSIWASFNLDFQSNLGTMRLANKLVTTTTGGTVGLVSAFDFYKSGWYAICGNVIFRIEQSGLITGEFSRPAFTYSIGDSTTQFDITDEGGNTFRYTYDGTGTDPEITALTMPIGAALAIQAQNFNAANNKVSGVTVTGSGNNYFEITNATGVAENDKTIGTGYIYIASSTTEYASDFDPQKSDIGLFNGKIWFTEKTRLYSYDKTKFVIEERGLTDSLHKLAYLAKRNRLYYTDNTTTIKSIDTNNLIASSGDYFLDTGGDFGQITTMVSDGEQLFIGTLMPNTGTSGEGSQGSVLIWDGISAQITTSLKLPTAGVLAMTVDYKNIYAIDAEGRILKYTGYSFDEIARLPINRTLLTNATAIAGTGRFIHFNGMEVTKNNTILVSINNLNSEDDTSSKENIASGIWELDLATGNFTHKYSFTLKAVDSSTVTDFGQNRVVDVGAIKINTMTSSIAASSAGRGTLLAGVTYYTDATTTASVISIDSPAFPDTNYEAQKRGYFVTTWMESNEITENFTRLWTTFKKFLNSTDKMIFKYRLNDEEPIEATITWTSTTTFTTTINISAYAGYEAEIIQGTGSGACANILTVTENAGTYTATIDTAITGVTGTAKARFQKWIKLGEVTGQVLSYGQMPIIQTDTRIQIKGILEWTGDNEFHKLCVVSTDNLKIAP